MSIFIEALLIFILLLANGILAMSEIAIVSARKSRLEQLATDGKRGARTALRLAEDPSHLLSTVQIGITLVGIFAGAFGGARVAQNIEGPISRIPLLAPHAEGLSVALVVIVITYFSLIIGELVPKRLALLHAEGIATTMARPLLLIGKGALPLVKILSLSTDLILKILGQGGRADQKITGEEIRFMIDQATQSGVMRQTEHEMIEGVMALGNQAAGELMTPRHEVVALDLSDGPEEIWKKVFESGHSYFPVIDGDLSKILGLTSVRDLAETLVSGLEIDLEASLAEPLYVPESASALRLFEKFKTEKGRLAFVVDEHGMTEGIITITDLLEAVVGELPSPEGDEEPELFQREDGSWLVDGGVGIERFRQRLKIKRFPESRDYKTLGGFVMTRLGRIPEVGDKLSWGPYHFEVIDMDHHRVDKLLVRRKSK